MNSGFSSGYLDFRELVTPQLIKVTYIIGAGLLTIAGLVVLLFPESVKHDDNPYATRSMGLIFLIGGNLVWRMMCEAAILLFSFHELLVSIDEHEKELVRQFKNYGNAPDQGPTPDRIRQPPSGLVFGRRAVGPAQDN